MVTEARGARVERQVVRWLFGAGDGKVGWWGIVVGGVCAGASKPRNEGEADEHQERKECREVDVAELLVLTKRTTSRMGMLEVV